MSIKNLTKIATIDGNEAVAYVAYRINEVCGIYPITPASPMAEHADEWSVKGVENIWGNIPPGSKTCKIIFNVTVIERIE